MVSDRWFSLAGAEALPREQAEAICAEEGAIAGQLRVRMVPAAPARQAG